MKINAYTIRDAGGKVLHKVHTLAQASRTVQRMGLPVNKIEAKTTIHGDYKIVLRTYRITFDGGCCLGFACNGKKEVARAIAWLKGWRAARGVAGMAEATAGV